GSVPRGTTVRGALAAISAHAQAEKCGAEVASAACPHNGVGRGPGALWGISVAGSVPVCRTAGGPSGQHHPEFIGHGTEHCLPAGLGQGSDPGGGLAAELESRSGKRHHPGGSTSGGTQHSLERVERQGSDITGAAEAAGGWITDGSDQAVPGGRPSSTQPAPRRSCGRAG